MTALDRVLPTPRKLELSSVEPGLAPERAWEVVRQPRKTAYRPN